MTGSWHPLTIGVNVEPDSNHPLGQRSHFVGPTLTKMALVRCHFAHRADLIANGCFDVGLTPLAQQALRMPSNANHSFAGIALGQRWSDMN